MIVHVFHSSLKWKWSATVSEWFYSIFVPRPFDGGSTRLNPFCFRFLRTVTGNRTDYWRMPVHCNRWRIHRPPQRYDGQRVRHGRSILSKGQRPVHGLFDDSIWFVCRQVWRQKEKVRFHHGNNTVKWNFVIDCLHLY